MLLHELLFHLFVMPVEDLFGQREPLESLWRLPVILTAAAVRVAVAVGVGVGAAHLLAVAAVAAIATVATVATVAAVAAIAAVAADTQTAVFLRAHVRRLVLLLPRV